MRSAWEAVFARGDGSWTKVRGPTSALRMSLYRLGWQMANFCTIIDDMGGTLQLLRRSPRRVGSLCFAAVWRGLE
eukprot:4479900-Pyramimonas_sp.AAC.1